MERAFLHFVMHMTLLVLCLSISIWGGYNIGLATHSIFWGFCGAAGQFFLMYGTMLAIMDSKVFNILIVYPLDVITILWMKILKIFCTEIHFMPLKGIPYQTTSIREYHEWTKDNCRGPVIYYLGRFFFWKKSDVIAFKLRFYGDTPYEWDVK